MILSDVDIKKSISAGVIKINPTPNFEEQLGPCSLDLHLGNSFKIFKVSRYPFIDLKNGVNVDEMMEEVVIKDGGSFIIQPHDFVIAITKEEITLPSNIMGRLDGRSSLARLGLVIHVTAARFDPGWRGRAVMELGNLGTVPIVLYSGMRICAMTFENLSSSSGVPYLKQADHKYADQNEATASKIVQEENLEKLKSKDDEQILVVPRDILFKKEIWWGLKTDNLDYYLNLIKNNCQFKRRGDVENNPSFKQIIPYMLFSFGDKFFAYKYLANAGEQRLVNNNYQLGVGGHINKEDVNGSENILETGMMREWNEEVDFKGNLLQKKFIGIINDDSKPVEQVHLGLVYHFVGDSPDIQVKETDKMEGKLLPMQELSADKIDHSVWMQIVHSAYLSKL